jgi:hypothetical protein
MRTALAPLLPLLALATGCAQGAGPVAVLAHPLGTRQCEAGGTTPQALAQALRAAGLTVLAVGCGDDGRMRPAVCGAPDGRLAVVELPAEQAARAQSLGWVPLSSLRGAQRLPCP